MPVFVPGPTTRIGALAQRSAKSSNSRTSAGTVEDRQIPSTVSRSNISPISAPSSSPVRVAMLASRAVLGEAVAVEEPEDRLGVADVDG